MSQVNLVEMQKRLRNLKQALDITHNAVDAELTVMLYEIAKALKEEKPSEVKS